VTVTTTSPIDYETPHRGASLQARELQSWLPGIHSADAELLDDLPALIARSRDLSRNHGVAAGAIQTLVDNIVGTGFVLNAKPDWRVLGKTKEWASEFAIEVESKWKSWAESFEYSADRKLNFHGQTQLVCRTQFISGEAVAVPLYIEGRGAKYGTSIQLVDPDRLSTPIGKRDSATMRAGIEINRYGEPIRYHIRKAHPREVGDGFTGSYREEDWEAIPARTKWGRPRVLHVHDMGRTGQNRGKPGLTSVMPIFRMMDKYEGAEVQAAVVNALVAGVVESGLPMEQIMGYFGEDMNAYMNAKKEYGSRVQLRSGTIIPLFPGDKFNSFTPSRPNANFGPFVEHIQRHIGTSIGLPLELLMKDFSKTNYSSARAALLEAWRYFSCRRDTLITYWCDPVYVLWFEEAVMRGEIDAPDFFENQYAWTQCEWIPDGRGWIDPLKEAQASKAKRDAGVSTLARECAEQGQDWRAVVEQQVAEELFIRDTRKAAGLDEVQIDPAEKAKLEMQQKQIDAQAQEREQKAADEEAAGERPDEEEEE
jgi:lambda family phage portal protein